MITDLLVRKAEAFERSVSLAAKFNKQQDIELPAGDTSPLMLKASALQEVITMIEGVAIDTTATEIVARPKLTAGSDCNSRTTLPANT
jgi:hypothetical protein